MGLVGWRSTTGGGVGGFEGASSRARACGVMEEKSKAAKVACDDMSLRESGFLLRMDCVNRCLVLERKGKIKGCFVVLGVGGEIMIWVPKKLEESSG